MNYNFYTAGELANGMLNELRTEASKNRKWAQALKAVRKLSRDRKARG